MGRMGGQINYNRETMFAIYVQLREGIYWDGGRAPNADVSPQLSVPKEADGATDRCPGLVLGGDLCLEACVTGWDPGSASTILGEE